MTAYQQIETLVECHIDQIKRSNSVSQNSIYSSILDLWFLLDLLFSPKVQIIQRHEIPHFKALIYLSHYHDSGHFNFSRTGVWHFQGQAMLTDCEKANFSGDKGVVTP